MKITLSNSELRTLGKLSKKQKELASEKKDAKSNSREVPSFYVR